MLTDLVIDHFGIVCADIAVASQQIVATMPVDAATVQFDDAVLGVSVRFFRDRNGPVFELIAPYGENSPVRNTLAQNHRLNQIAYRCSDLAAAASTLRKVRVMPVGRPAPAIAFGGAPVQFFWSPMGYVIELIEAAAFEHAFTPLRH